MSGDENEDSMLMCFFCEKTVQEDNAECDECENVFHVKCMKVKPAELKARQNSKCLRLYCPF